MMTFRRALLCLAAGCVPAMGLPGCDAAAAPSAVIGAAVASRTGASVEAATAEFEARLGYGLGGHRLYMPDFSVPTGWLDDDAAHGRISYLSIRPPGGSGAWRLFADSGRPLMDGLARQLGAITADGSHRITVALEHEPDEKEAGMYRSDFRDMQTQFLSAVRQFAPNVETQIIFGGYKLYDGELTRDQMAEYLPVDRSLLDMIGTDPFGFDNTDSNLSQVVSPMVGLADAVDKPLALDEVGVRYLTCDRTRWLTDALEWIKTQPRINAVLWFQNSVGANPAEGYDPNHDFWLEGDGTTYANNIETFDTFKFMTADDSSWVKSTK